VSIRKGFQKHLGYRPQIFER